jgi:hypothetical protein
MPAEGATILVGADVSEMTIGTEKPKLSLHSTSGVRPNTPEVLKRGV